MTNYQDAARFKLEAHTLTTRSSKVSIKELCASVDPLRGSHSMLFSLRELDMVRPFFDIDVKGANPTDRRKLGKQFASFISGCTNATAVNVFTRPTGGGVHVVLPENYISLPHLYAICTILHNKVADIFTPSNDISVDYKLTRFGLPGFVKPESTGPYSDEAGRWEDFIFCCGTETLLNFIPLLQMGSVLLACPKYTGPSPMETCLTEPQLAYMDDGNSLFTMLLRYMNISDWTLKFIVAKHIIGAEARYRTLFLFLISQGYVKELPFELFKWAPASPEELDTLKRISQRAQLSLTHLLGAIVTLLVTTTNNYYCLLLDTQMPNMPRQPLNTYLLDRLVGTSFLTNDSRMRQMPNIYHLVQRQAKKRKRKDSDSDEEIEEAVSASLEAERTIGSLINVMLMGFICFKAPDGGRQSQRLVMYMNGIYVPFTMSCLTLALDRVLVSYNFKRPALLEKYIQYHVALYETLAVNDDWLKGCGYLLDDGAIVCDNCKFSNFPMFIIGSSILNYTIDDFYDINTPLVHLRLSDKLWPESSTETDDLEQTLFYLYFMLGRSRERVQKFCYILTRLFRFDFRRYMICLYGPGKNGKTTLCTTLARILHRAFAAIDRDKLRKMDALSPDLWGAKDAAVMYVDDPGSTLDPATVKSLTGEGYLYLRTLYEKGGQVELSGPTIVTTNERIIAGNDVALLDRLVYIHARVRFHVTTDKEKGDMRTQLASKADNVYIHQSMKTVIQRGLFTILKSSREVWEAQYPDLNFTEDHFEDADEWR